MADETTDHSRLSFDESRRIGPHREPSVRKPTEQGEVWTDLTADVTYPEADFEPTEQAGREALAERQRLVDILAAAPMADVVSTSMAIIHQADAVLAAGYVPPTAHAALQRRLDEAEAALRRVAAFGDRMPALGLRRVIAGRDA